MMIPYHKVMELFTTTFYDRKRKGELIGLYTYMNVLTGKKYNKIEKNRIKRKKKQKAKRRNKR